MALFNKHDLLAGAGAITKTFSRDDVVESLNATRALATAANEFETWKSYDIFLSHAYEDKVLINNLRKSLIDLGHSVYVDWVEDGDLERDKVTKDTVLRLRSRMDNCKCLFYATSSNATKSKWMPWELGYFDGHKGRVAVLPIVETPEASFSGQEYLAVYPYVDRTEKNLWINESLGKFVSFTAWLAGENPKSHGN